MSVTDIPFKKRVGLELFRQQRNTAAKQHRLSYLFWECTLRCNLACKHCGSDCHKNMQQRDMPISDFLKVVDSITPNVDVHDTMIVITGGEPLLRDDLEECGKELYKREYPWGAVTNGMLVTETRLHSLLNAGMHAMTVSLDGLSDAHNVMRGNYRSFSQAMNAIKLLSSAGDEVIFDVVTCVTAQTFSQLSDIKNLLIKAGVKFWRIFTVFPSGRAKLYKDLQLNAIQFRELFEFIKKTRQEGQIELSYGCEGFLGNYETEVRDNFFFCQAGINIGSILADGSISACPSMRSNFIQGNIYQDDFMEVWNNRFLPHRNRTWAKKDECADCKFWRFCQGNGMHLRNEEGELMFCHLRRIEEGEGSTEPKSQLVEV